MPRFKNRNTRYKARPRNVTTKYLRRKYGGVKRTKRTYRPKMTKKRILNVTSKKKHDTMLTTTNISASSQYGGSAYIQAPAIITGASNAIPIVWCATARDASYDSKLANPTDTATRTAQTCFMRGLSEKIEIQVADGMPWQWRRICFTYRNLTTLIPNTTEAGKYFYSYLSIGNLGYNRVLNMLPHPDIVATLESVLFRGVKGKDWQSAMIASVDKLRVDVKYDKTITISSGNEDGVIRKYSRWHGMNKNLVYADDESGGEMIEAYHSVSDKRGMGDYYIVDYFAPRAGATSSNQISVGMSSTLYWHEK
uniref:Capsid protein n=1 Tax=Red panda feces-associated gemycircularvirus TaxID=2864013 RepID=A0A8K1HHM4_9VIRU|nr:capsid protein [Red panda feces-associated gemycircularvirus]